MQYNYAPNFGQADNSGKQDAIDKKVLKKLSQVNKEDSFSFPALLKKLRHETLRTMHYEKEEKLLTNMVQVGRTMLHMKYGQAHFTEFRTLPTTIVQAIRLDTTQYSQLTTKQEHTHHTLTVEQTRTIPQCTMVPPCPDCTNNGAYSTCTSRARTAHKTTYTLPLAHYWHLALFNTLPKADNPSHHTLPA
jgi:hypothetical protein